MTPEELEALLAEIVGQPAEFCTQAGIDPDNPALSAISNDEIETLTANLDAARQLVRIRAPVLSDLFSIVIGFVIAGIGVALALSGTLVGLVVAFLSLAWLLLFDLQSDRQVDPSGSRGARHQQSQTIAGGHRADALTVARQHGGVRQARVGLPAEGAGGAGVQGGGTGRRRCPEPASGTAVDDPRSPARACAEFSRRSGSRPCEPLLPPPSRQRAS